MAGSWADIKLIVGGEPFRAIDPIGLRATFTADASDGSIPILGGETEDLAGKHYGFLTGVEVVFGSPAPDTVTMTIKDKDGVVVSDDFPLTLTASGRANLARAVQIWPGTQIVLTGNTINSATGSVKLATFR